MANYFNTSLGGGGKAEQTYNSLSENAQSGKAVAEAISGKVDESSLAAVATSGDYNDLNNKPSAVTEDTVSDWGFTKNTGDYNKPEGGIPKTDLSNDVQTSLGKADSALQSFTEEDPTVPSHVKEITAQNIADWNAKSEFSGSYNDLSDTPDLTVYSLVSEAGYDLGLSMDSKTYEMTLELKNKAGTVLSTKTLDFPIESMVVDAEYADGTITLSLQSGSTLDVDISAIVGGLVNDSFTIAGIDMKDDITAAELKTALGVPDTFAPVNAQENIIETIKVNNVVLTPSSKAVNIVMPTQASDIGALPDTTEIPTEETVADWGFTKNSGTYSKPDGGIPASDLADGVIPAVDQSYDPTSENAQSGVAIAEALENVEIDVDDALSTTSENPVQNKVITNELQRMDKFVGTQSEWDALSDEDKAFYEDKIVNITDDFDDSVVDLHYDSNSLNAQSGKAVAEAVANFETAFTGTRSEWETFKDKEKFENKVVNITDDYDVEIKIDQEYDPTSERAQSGTAVAGAINSKADSDEVTTALNGKISKPDTATEGQVLTYNGSTWIADDSKGGSGIWYNDTEPTGADAIQGMSWIG